MIVAHLEFTVKHAIDHPLEGVTREMIQKDIGRIKAELAEELRADFAKAGREIANISVVFTKKVE